MIRALFLESASTFLPSLCRDVLLSCLKEPEQIGIIAPYRAQCTKLRQALKPIAPGIKVGSVEEYQGDVSDRDPIQQFFILTAVWAT